MDCSEALARIPRYLDEELSEAEAAPLRTHLMDCLDCRGHVQDARSVSAWFVKPAPVEVPDGFAARVSRRAVAGDRGVLGAPMTIPAPVPATVTASGPVGLVTETGDDRMRSFVVSAVAVAALVLLALSIGLRRMDMPDSQGLSADDAGTDQALEALRELNEREAALETKE